MGCIVRVAEVLTRLDMVEKQKTFLNTISKALHIPSDEAVGKPLAKLMLCMMTYDVFFVSSEEEIKVGEERGVLKRSCINYHGACLLKSCLMFKKSKGIVSSFLELTEAELVSVALHPSGSFVFESFLQNESIPAKKKKELTEKLLDSVYILSCDKFGSRVIDSIWVNIDSDMQAVLQNRLRQHTSKLESDLYGRIVLCNCGVIQKVEKNEGDKRKTREKTEII